MPETNSVENSSKHYMRNAGISFLAVIILLIAGYLLYMRYDFKTLYSGLDIEDAALIAAELDRQEVRYRVGDEGESIQVPKSDIDSVRLAIHSSEGPTQGLIGFELFNESEMGLTDFAQKIKFQRAIQGELSRTIMMMDGVRKARVHIAIPERSVFRSQRTDAKAAVTLIAKDGHEFGDENILGIQRVVASSVPSLSVKHVTVVNGQGRIISQVSEISEHQELEEAPDFVGSKSVDNGMYQVAAFVSPLDPKSLPVELTSNTKTAPRLKPQPENVSGQAGQTPYDDAPMSENNDTVKKESVIKEATAVEILTPQASVLEGQVIQRAAVIQKGLPFWVLLLLALLALMIVVGIILFNRSRNGLTIDQRKAFAAELSESLRGSNVEASHG